VNGGSTALTLAALILILGPPAAVRASAEQGSAAAAADSIDVLEEILSRGDAADEEEAVAVAAALNEEFAPQGVWLWRNRAFLRVEETAGYRNSRRAEGGWRDGTRLCRVSFRQDRDRYGGCVEAGGWGPLDRLVAGGIRPRFGEGLLLGTRYSPFAPPQTRGPGVGAVAPTSSIWGRKFGAALSLRARGYGASAVAWREDDMSEVYWTWISVGTRAGTLGIAAGTRRLSGGIGGVDVSVAGTRDSSVGLFAGEAAVFRRRVFAAIRATVRAGGNWTFELFNSPAPRGYSGGVVSPGDETRVRGGGALHRAGQTAGLDTRVSLYANARRTPSEVVERRRLDASVRGRTGTRGRWNASLRLVDERESEYSQETIDYLPVVTRRRQAHLRAGWTGGDGALRHRYRLTARFDDPRAVGVVGVVGLGVVFGGQEAGFQVSNYSMASGQTGYVVPSGAGSPLMMSTVTRTGSSVSARIRLRWRGLRVAWYWSQPWQRPPRAYLSASLSL
jgi:hypothetical protein